MNTTLAGDQGQHKRQYHIDQYVSLIYDEIELHPVFFLPKSHNLSLIIIPQKSGKLNLRNILQNIRPILLKTVKVINNREYEKLLHPEKPKAAL